MTTHHKDACHCGSGKRYKHCHMAADQAKARRGWIGAIGVLAALAVGFAAWGGIAQWRASRAQGGGAGDSLALPASGRVAGGGGDVAGTTSPAPQGTFGAVVPGSNAGPPIAGAASGPAPLPTFDSELQPGENPAPWQYDMARNRHYDPRPGHRHWHEGPPPSDTTTATPAPMVTVGGANTKVTTSIMPAPKGNMDLQPGENPAPWEYDKARDRHFNPNPGHKHWHAGPPPPVSQRSP